MDSDAIHRRTIAKTTFTLTLPLAFSLLTYFFLGRWIYSEFLFFGTYSTRAVDVFPESEEVVVLKNTLRKAAMEEDNKTIILTTLNAAWTDKGSIFDLFLEGFKSGIGTQQLLNHVVVLAVDPTAYNRCMEAHLHCYALKTQGVDFSGHKNFMTPDYIKLMWRRLEFSIQVLQLGFHFIFTDADIVWFRNPFLHFYVEGDDLQFSCDFYNHNSTDRRNPPNAGFMYVKSNHKTIDFLTLWFKAHHRFPGKRLQQVLAVTKFHPTVDRVGLRMRFLDTVNFGGLCEPQNDIDLIVTMHTQCCTGMAAKINDMNVAIDDWKRYRNNGANKKWSMGKRKCGRKKEEEQLPYRQIHR